MANTNIYNLVDTWADVAVVFASIKFNITDTLSHADSKLIHMQIASVDRFTVGKRGNIYANTILAAAEDDNAVHLDILWNTTANTSAIFANITDTASGSDSMAVDLQSSSVRFFTVDINGQVIVADNIVSGATDFMHETNATLADNAAVGAGTLTNAPTAGDPTKWVAINDNGTTRYFPTWT